ncbi:Proline--tRNA ligase [Frankliniella fusca]|uniref:Proline--tRNA ligase n=1 Tax=Frankliniella fusca TaxID=407009 RepID=A0AAE1HRA1_9NEOP|nr:Proline--tRNA ligase [Frankliniella fusca]
MWRSVATVATKLYMNDNAKFPPELRAECPSSIPSVRTTNPAEGFHSDFNRQFNSSHPNMHILCETILLIQNQTYITINTIKKGRLHQESNQARERRIRRTYMETGSYVPLKNVPKTIRPHFCRPAAEKLNIASYNRTVNRITRPQVVLCALGTDSPGFAQRCDLVEKMDCEEKDASKEISYPIKKKKKNVPVRKRLADAPSVENDASSVERPPSASVTSPLSLPIPELSTDSSINITDLSLGSLGSPPLFCSTDTGVCSSAPEPSVQNSSPVLDSDAKPLLFNVKDKLAFLLPNLFIPVVDNGGIHILQIGRRESKAVQREIFVSTAGAVRMEVHGYPFDPRSLLSGVLPQQPLTPDNEGYFIDRVLQIVGNVRLLEICAGVDKEEYKDVWDVIEGDTIVDDTFKECRYTETLRSKICVMLIDAKKWRCMECTKLQPFLRRALHSKKNICHPHTNNRFLQEDQKL